MLDGKGRPAAACEEAGKAGVDSSCPRPCADVGQDHDARCRISWTPPRWETEHEGSRLVEHGVLLDVDAVPRQKLVQTCRLSVRSCSI